MLIGPVDFGPEDDLDQRNEENAMTTEHDHTLARWTCGCDPMLTGIMEAAVSTGNIAVTVGHRADSDATQRPVCGWPAAESPSFCGEPGAMIVRVMTFDEPPLAALVRDQEKPTLLILCAKHWQTFEELT